MSFWQFRRRVFGALKNFLSELSLEGDSCVKQYVPYTPTDSVTLEHANTILLLLAVIILLLAIILVLVVSLIRSAKKHNRASELVIKHTDNIAKNVEELNRFQSWPLSPPSEANICESCLAKKTITVSTFLAESADPINNVNDVNEGSFVHITEQGINSNEDGNDDQPMFDAIDEPEKDCTSEQTKVVEDDDDASDDSVSVLSDNAE